MSICFGGVCIPYTALWPLTLLVIQRIYSYLFGNLIKKPEASSSALKEISKEPSCRSENNQELSPPQDSTGKVIDIQDSSEFRDLIRFPTMIKFTATWCKPCQSIAPYFESLAAQHRAIHFATVDVDKLDEIAAVEGAYKLPYFVAYTDSKQIDSESTSDRTRVGALLVKAFENHKIL